MKCTKRIFWTVVVVVTLWVLLVQVANWRGARAWERAQERLESSGEIWTLEQLTPGPVADADNFFATEALLGLNRVGGEDRGEGPYGAKRARLESIYPLRRVDGHTPPAETTTGRRHGGARDFGALLNYVREAGTVEVGPGGVAGGDASQRLGEALEEAHGGLFAELEAAASRKYSRIESNLLNLDEGKILFGVQLPHLFAMQSLGKTMRLRAGLAAANGDGERARGSVAVLLRLAEGAGGEPVYVAQLVASAIEAMAVDAVWEGLEAGCFSEADLAWLQSEFEAIDPEKGYLAAIRGELLAGLDAMGMFLRRNEGSGEMISAIGVLGEASAASAGVANFGVSLSPGGWFDQNRATLVNWSLDYQIEPMKSGGLGEVIAMSKKLEDTLIEAKDNYFRWPHTVIPALIMPAMGSIGRTMQLRGTLLEACVVACALERSRLAEGGYPERLEALVPRFLAAVPGDPHAAGPVSYRTEGEGFVLWTVGPDGEDDGGEAGEGRERDDQFEGDWVWRQRVGVVDVAGE